MQEIARRMGHSETAFLVRRGDDEYDLRWFSPATEVPLCGHATLAAAHYLREAGLVDTASTVRFATRAGELRAHYGPDAITLDLPARPGRATEVSDLEGCLGVPILSAVRNGSSIVAEVADMEALRSCRPDYAAIARLRSEDLIVVTATGVDGFDYAYRCFAPQLGIPEDPVTGSANCILAPLWAGRLGKQAFRALQASPEGGALDVRVNGERVGVGGKAVTAGIAHLDLDRDAAECA